MNTLENVTPIDFANIGDQMVFKDAALNQLDAFKTLVEKLRMPAIIVGSHTSKSIKLPVVRIAHDGYRFFLRDNFHGVDLCVLAPTTIDLPVSELLGTIMKPKDWDWYLGEIERCRNYSWEYFSDEEMHDPRILRVFKPHRHSKDGKLMEWSCEADKKDRWIKRMTDPEWYYKDWSSCKLSWDGEFGPGVKLFFQSHAFLEGISDTEAIRVPGWDQPYEPGCKAFAIDVGNFENAEKMIRKLTRTEP